MSTSHGVMSPGCTTPTASEITGGFRQSTDYIGQVHVTGDYNTFTGFRLHDLNPRAAGNVTAGFSFNPSAAYCTVTDFSIDTPAGGGFVLSDSERGAPGTYPVKTSNYGANNITIRNGTISHWSGRVGINAYGDGHLTEDGVLEGGPGGPAPFRWFVRE